MQRPTGITVLAIAILTIAAFRFIISFLDMAIGSWLTAMAMSPGYMPIEMRPYADAIGDLGFWIGLFGMAVALVLFIAARGLWMMKKSSWWLTLICLVVALILNVIPMLQGTVTTRLITEALFDVVFLVYLVTPGVRGAFGDAQSNISQPA